MPGDGGRFEAMWLLSSAAAACGREHSLVSSAFRVHVSWARTSCEEVVFDRCCRPEDCPVDTARWGCCTFLPVPGVLRHPRPERRVGTAARSSSADRGRGSPKSCPGPWCLRAGRTGALDHDRAAGRSRSPGRIQEYDALTRARLHVRLGRLRLPCCRAAGPSSTCCGRLVSDR
jgi:hypothetical protein